MFEHLSEDKKRVNVRDFGAVGDGVADDTAAIIAAADSLSEGGIVYFPAGIYLMDFIPFREGVTYLLEGKVDDVAAGYTEELQRRIDAGEFAVLRSMGKGDMFLNHEKEQFATGNAVSNYGLSGGVIDCVGRVRAFIFIHCENVLLENCVILDSPNNHSIQVTGARDVMIRNCMFAGYNFRGNLYAETIQIEQSHSGAIGWQMFTTSNVSYGEYRFCENVTVEGCYFGKSANYGAPLIPIGHHGQEYKSSVTGCYIRKCVFDNPLYMALRPYAYSDLVVEDCTFISTENRLFEESDAMITYLLKKPNPRAIAVDDNGNLLHATYEPGYACEGSLGSKIRRNKFILGGDRIGRIINANGIYRRGMKVTTHMLKIDEFGGKAYVFHGYRKVKDLISELEFCDNEIVVLNRKPAVTDYLMRFEKVCGLTLSGNVIKSNIGNYSDWYCSNEAVRLVDCYVGDDDKARYIEGDTAAGRRIIIPMGDGGEARVHCSCKLTLSLYCEAGGSIETDADARGNAIVTVTPDEGYVFVGWETADSDYRLEEGESELNGSISLIAIFKKA